MMMDYITLAGFALAVFGAGVAAGRIVEKISRISHKLEDEKYDHRNKKDRR